MVCVDATGWAKRRTIWPSTRTRPSVIQVRTWALEPAPTRISHFCSARPSCAAEAGGSLGGHVAKLLAFGYFHVMDVRYG